MGVNLDRNVRVGAGVSSRRKSECNLGMANNFCIEATKGHIRVGAEKVESILEGLECPAPKSPCVLAMSPSQLDRLDRSGWVWGNMSRTWAGVQERD